MTNYDKMAKDFLKDCNASIKMLYVGREVNSLWNESVERDSYIVNISTPKGNMQVKFWDSLYNTQRNKINKIRKIPTEYDVLSCLTTYDVGDFEDFLNDFEYEIKAKGDLKRFYKTYLLVKQENEDIHRIFTESQIEQLQEIL